MTRLVLANSDYRKHTTSEGNELQLGLSAAGWLLAGRNCPIDMVDVPAILDHAMPDVVLVQDKRDWDGSNLGCFDKSVSFEHVETLAKQSGIFKIAVVKDAGSCVAYHREFCEQIAADAVLTYYHDTSVLPLSSWLRNYPRIRTYHSVDASYIRSEVSLFNLRKEAVVSGALSDVYPLRKAVWQHAGGLGYDRLAHPGYSNARSWTRDYLRTLAGYKVHIATASKYGFALRKIIESVAVGAIPVTNLPEYDVLPGIDDALCRVPVNASIHDVADAVRNAVKIWDVEERTWWAHRAWQFYDYHTIARRLDDLITRAGKRGGE